MRRVFVAVCFALVLGCGGYQSSPSTIAVITPDPKFKGNPAEKRINWDIAGVWNVHRFGTEDKPGKLGRWETKWNIGPDHEPGVYLLDKYFDKITGDTFRIWTIQIGDTDRVADMIFWQQVNGKRWFLSINEQSFGFLMMTGDDDERYMAARSD